MRALLLFASFFLSCIFKANSQNIVQKIKSKYYTTKDTVKITTLNLDTLVFSGAEFNQIIDSLPSLYQEFVVDPDINYNSRTTTKAFLNKDGDIYMSFNSEVGQDSYYILYAYFLKQKTGEQKYSTRRTKLTQIYNTINRIFSRLNNGGTYFGHQYRRIIGYTEYSIYWYSQREDFFSKKYNIKTQKEIYLNSIRQLIKDELPDDGDTTGIDRTKKEKELNEMVDTLSTLIDDAFYLKRAQAFQYSYY